jgi:hypothetical protein
MCITMARDHQSGMERAEFRGFLKKAREDQAVRSFRSSVPHRLNGAEFLSVARYLVIAFRKTCAAGFQLRQDFHLKLPGLGVSGFGHSDQRCHFYVCSGGLDQPAVVAFCAFL